MIIYERVFASRSICYWHSCLSLYEGPLSKVRAISQKKLELKWVKRVRVALRIFKLSEKIFCHFGKWANDRLITLRGTKQSREFKASICLKLEVGHGVGVLGSSDYFTENGWTNSRFEKKILVFGCMVSKTTTPHLKTLRDDNFRSCWLSQYLQNVIYL